MARCHVPLAHELPRISLTYRSSFSLFFLRDRYSLPPPFHLESGVELLSILCLVRVFLSEPFFPMQPLPARIPHSEFFSRSRLCSFSLPFSPVPFAAFRKEKRFNLSSFFDNSPPDVFFSPYPPALLRNLPSFRHFLLVRPFLTLGTRRCYPP